MKKTDDKGTKLSHGGIAQVVHYSTQYLGISQFNDSTVVRMQNNILHGGIFSSNRYKSEEYLLNFKCNNNYMGNRMGAGNFYQSGGLLAVTQRQLEEDLENATILPKVQKIKAGLSDVILSRRSVRNFKAGEMSIKDLSNILFYTQGVCETVPTKFDYVEEVLDLKLRCNPSAGGLYPIKLNLFIKNVKGLEEGIYSYYPENHAIKLITKKEHMSDIGSYADFAMINIYNVNLIIFYIYDFFVNSRKYGDIGAAFAMIEAGEMAQNLQLTSTALGYGACDIGGYNKDLIEEDINIDGMTKHLIHVTIVGNEGD